MDSDYWLLLNAQCFYIFDFYYDLMVIVMWIRSYQNAFDIEQSYDCSILNIAFFIIGSPVIWSLLFASKKTTTTNLLRVLSSFPIYLQRVLESFLLKLENLR